MIRIYLYTILCFGLVAGLQAVSQTENEFVRMALQNNRQIEAASYLLEISKARIEQSMLLPDPELQVELDSDFIGNNEGESNFRIGVSQRFPFSKRLQHAESLSKLEFAIVEEEIVEMKWLLARKVRAACLNLRVVQSKIELQQRMLELLSGWLSFTESGFRKGEISGLDASQIKLEVAEIEQSLRSLNIERKLAAADLKQLLGLEHDEEVEIELDGLSLTASPIEIPIRTDAEVLSQRSDYQAALLAVQKSDTAVVLAESEKWADFSVGLSLSRESSVDEPVGNTTNHAVGVAFSIPLPIRKANQLHVREKIAEKEYREAALRSIEFGILQQLHLVQQEVSLNLEQISSYSEGVLQEYDRHVRMNEEAYQNGQIDLPTLLRAQESRLDLETQMIANLQLYYESVNRLQHLSANDPVLTQ